MPSPTDFNLSPYYDDYSEDKKFHRVLFRPAFSVQARELTQLQTIQQNQIERLSDHFFEKGSMVIPGEISYDLNYTAVKLTSFAGSTTLSDYVGKTFTTDPKKRMIVGISSGGNAAFTAAWHHSHLWGKVLSHVSFFFFKNTIGP